MSIRLVDENDAGKMCNELEHPKYYAGPYKSIKG
jgi:hypothetical protein